MPSVTYHWKASQEATTVKIAVRYMAQLRRAAGTAIEQVELDAPCSAADLLKRLAEQHGLPFRALLPMVLLFVGDEQVGPETAPLRDGDVVTVLTPMAGG
jgi:molybdopterin synthase sulfur carrier subunit